MTTVVPDYVGNKDCCSMMPGSCNQKNNYMHIGIGK